MADANQRVPVTDAVKKFYHEQLILGGSPFISSIFGPHTYKSQAPSIPAFYRDPIITGSVVAPSTLTCEAQSFTSNPRAVITYLWKKNGSTIENFSTSITYDTFIEDVGDDFTCQVTITNGSGSDIGLSNIITMEAIVPSYIYEFDFIILQGLNNSGRMDLNACDVLVSTGVGIEGTKSVNELDQCTILGMRNDVKIDIDEAESNVISGVSGKNKIDINVADPYVLTGMQSLESDCVNAADAYAMWVPIFVADLVVLNGDAENANMSDWTMDLGTVFSVTTAPIAFGADLTLRREGSRFFKPEDRGQGNDSQMSQSIAIAGGDEALVDAGRCYALFDLIHQSEAGIDHLEITMEALKADLSVLNTETTIVPLNPPGSFGGGTEGWMYKRNIDEPLHLPTLTRFVKLIVLFVAHDTQGSSANTVYVDDFHIELVTVE